MLPVNGSGSFQQMVSERGNLLSPLRFAVLIVLCLTAHKKNRRVVCLLAELNVADHHYICREMEEET